jgi:acyl-coenzyme A thioesterase PaaI-like protein
MSTDLAARAVDLPLPRSLGCELRDPADPAAGARLVVTPAGDNGAGGLHAGGLAVLTELAAFLAALPHLGPDEHVATHSAQHQLLRAVRLGQAVDAVGTVLHRSRRLVFVRVDVMSGGVLVATSQVVKSVVRPAPGPSN